MWGVWGRFGPSNQVECRKGREGRRQMSGLSPFGSRSEPATARPTQVRESLHRGWVFEEKVDGWGILALQGRCPRRARSAGTAATTSAASLTSRRQSPSCRRYPLSGALRIFIQPLKGNTSKA
jgi:hypothetical protein